MLTTKEISEKLQVSEETVRRWIRTQKLKATQEGKSYFISEEALKHFIERESKSGASTSLKNFGKVVKYITANKPNNYTSSLLGEVIDGFTDHLSTSMKKKKIEDNLEKYEKETLVNENDHLKAVEEIEDRIDLLQRQKRRIEIDFQNELLKLDEEIANHKKLKRQIEKENEEHE